MWPVFYVTLCISSTTIAAAFSFGAGSCPHLLALSEALNGGQFHSNFKKEKQEFILRSLLCKSCCISVWSLPQWTVALLVACKFIFQNRIIYFIAIRAFWTDKHFFSKVLEKHLSIGSCSMRTQLSTMCHYYLLGWPGIPWADKYLPPREAASSIIPAQHLFFLCITVKEGNGGQNGK